MKSASVWLRENAVGGEWKVEGSRGGVAGAVLILDFGFWILDWDRDPGGLGNRSMDAFVGTFCRILSSGDRGGRLSADNLRKLLTIARESGPHKGVTVRRRRVVCPFH
jgi:hypothetical protein